MYVVKDLERRGRGLVAARTIKAGETILSEEPLLLTIAQDAKDYACAHCLRLLSSGGPILAAAPPLLQPPPSLWPHAQADARFGDPQALHARNAIRWCSALQSARR